MIRYNYKIRLRNCVHNKTKTKHFKWILSQNGIILRYGKQNKDYCIVHNINGRDVQRGVARLMLH